MDKDGKYFAASKTEFDIISGFQFPKVVEISLEQKIQSEEYTLNSIFRYLSYYNKDLDVIEAICFKIRYIIDLKTIKLKQDHCE